MKIFSIISYWLNKETGEIRTNKNWVLFKVAPSYDEMIKWTKNHREEYFFRADEVFKPGEINEANLKFDYSVKEVTDILIKDILDNEYRIKMEIVSKIEVQRIEIPINNN